MSKNSKILIGVLAIVAVIGVALGVNNQGLQGKIALKDLPFSILTSTSPSDYSVVSGTKNALVGSWDIKTTKNVKMNGLVFAFKGDNPETLGQIKLTIDGQEVEKKFLNKKEVYFHLNYNLEKGKTKKIYLHTDITGGSKETKFNFVLRKALATEIASSKSIEQSYGLIGPAITVVKVGKLSITLDPSTPKEDIVIAGTEVPVSLFKVTTELEPFVIKKLTIKNIYNQTPGDKDNNIATVLINYLNNEGKNDTKTGFLVNGQAEFTDLNIPVSGQFGSSKVLIYAKTNPIGVGSTAGEMISLDVDTFEAVGQSSGEQVTGVKTGGKPNFMHIYSSKPVLTLSTNSPSGSKTLSQSDKVFAFDVQNYGNDEIRIAELVINIASNEGLYPLPSSPPSQKLAVLKDAVTGAVVMGPSSVFLNNTSFGEIKFYSQMNNEFIIQKNQTKKLILELDSLSFIKSTAGTDTPVTFYIDYGSSTKGEVTPGGVTWESNGKSVQWLGNVGTKLQSNTLKY